MTSLKTLLVVLFSLLGACEPQVRIDDDSTSSNDDGSTATGSSSLTLARALPARLLVPLFALPVGAVPTKLAQQDRVLDADRSPLEGGRGVVVAPCDAGTEGVALRPEERD